MSMFRDDQHGQSLSLEGDYNCDYVSHDCFGEDGGRSSTVIRASEFKSEDPGFNPLVEQGEGEFSCPSESTLVQTCLCLTPPPLRLFGTHQNLCAH